MQTSLLILRWYAVLAALGLVASTFGPWVLRGFAAPERTGTYRALGVFVFGYFVWLGGSAGILPFNPQVLRLALAGALLPAVCRLALRVAARPPRWRFPTVHLRGVLAYEALFASSFALFVLIRATNPDIWGAEKFMDAAFFNGVRTSETFPPHDPWFSGGVINYYYFGYLLSAMLAHLSGVPFRIAYNLSVATQFALTVTATAAVGATLTRRFRGGLAASLVVCCFGNYHVFGQLLGGTHGPGNIDIFGATRVIKDTINEFPFFSFLWADLHPHLHALPYVIVLLGCYLSRALAPRFRGRCAGRLLGDELPVALLAGGLGFMNAWDVPSYTLLGLATALCWRGARARTLGISVIIGPVFYLPFYLGFTPQGQGLRLVPAELRSGLFPFLIVMGFFLLVHGVELLRPLSEALRRERELPARERAALLHAAIALLVLGALVATAANGVVAAMIFALLALAAQRLVAAFGESTRERFTWLLSSLGLAILLGCEVVYMKDFYGDALARMNTVFKFHFQAWVLLGISGAAIIARYWHAWVLDVKTAVGVLALGALVFPALGPLGAATDQPLSLDGMRHMQFYHGEDYALALWIDDHLPPEATLLEAVGKPYQYAGRISANTGRQTVLGWSQHEALWRNDWSVARDRESLVERAYKAPDLEEMRRLLEPFGSDYVVFGETERTTYGAAAEEKLRPLPVSFAQGQTRLYQLGTAGGSR
ncbi:MAG: hypothetical protein HYV63_15830 [Candidatus Schekmanbacteria bacterium]|nr:hypothetical protein [Candidatus Schekmanbacteria bacterium]